MKLGYLPDAHDPRDFVFARDFVFESSPLLGGLQASPSKNIDLSPHLDAVQTQVLNSCVGHSIASASVITSAALGRPIARPSPLFPYTLARLVGGPPIRDTGCVFRDAMRGVRDYGLVTEERWPEHPEQANAVPPLDAFIAGDGAKVEAFYRILGGQDAPTALRAALSRGLTPVFGMQVDQAYEAYRKGLYAPAGRLLGGHAQVIVGYAAATDAFRVLNSWGSSWGDGGFAWIHASLFSHEVFDMWVMSILPGALS